MSDWTQLQTAITTAVQALGYELWGIELTRQGKQQCLCIYIDSPEGVGVDDCAKVSRQVGVLLDAEDMISAGGYRLEVSSPGLERPLFKKVQYERYVGHKIKLRLCGAKDGRRNFIGTLQAIVGDDITLLLDDAKTLELPLASIDKANLIADI